MRHFSKLFLAGIFSNYFISRSFQVFSLINVIFPASFSGAGVLRIAFFLFQHFMNRTWDPTHFFKKWNFENFQTNFDYSNCKKWGVPGWNPNLSVAASLFKTVLDFCLRSVLYFCLRKYSVVFTCRQKYSKSVDERQP